MKRMLALAWLISMPAVFAAEPQTIEIPTRTGVIQKFVLIAPEKPKAAVILFSGGNGWINVEANGRIKRQGNFLVRSRTLFAEHDLMVAVVDVPSDRNREPYLTGFRQTHEHVADIKAVIGWLKQKANVPVWLVGTSRGTQSAAYIATQLAPGNGGPDGIVLTSTVIIDQRGGRGVSEMDLDNLRVPTLVVHHRQDGCKLCLYNDLPRMMHKLPAALRTELLTFDGGVSEGDPCGARAYHGYNRIEPEVVAKIAAWVLAQ